MTEFGRKYTRASTVNKTADTAKRQKERLAKVSFLSCQRNLIKTFQIEGMIALITKMHLIFS